MAASKLSVDASALPHRYDSSVVWSHEALVLAWLEVASN